MGEQVAGEVDPAPPLTLKPHHSTELSSRIRLHDVRHSYASAALKAGIPAKVISERLGHSTAAFTLQTYTHVIPGMDAAAADAVAALIQGGRQTTEDAANESIVHGSVHTDVEELPEMTSGPAKAGPDLCSGGRI